MNLSHPRREGFFNAMRTPEAVINIEDGFDTAQVVDTFLRQRSSYANRPDADRILPVAESPELFPSTGSINFQNDFERIDRLHQILGMKGGQRLSHDPAFERARFERATTDEERLAVQRGVIVNMERTLYERARSSQSTVVYYQDNQGRIYHPDFPGEPFDRVLQRGLENSKRHGFVDFEREEKEFEGWKKVMTTLFSPQTPVGTKEVVISGPGLVRGSAFTDNFVDIFTKEIDSETGRTVVVMTRLASGVSYEQYRQIASRLNANYFGGKEIEDARIDIFFKEYPILIEAGDLRDAEQFFRGEFIVQKGATEEGKTRHYLDQCRLFILHYAEVISANFFHPEQVKLAFNAAINKFDEVRKGVVGKALSISMKVLEFSRDQIEYYGRKPVEAMMVGCGLLAGFSIGVSLGKLFSNGISAIGGIFGGLSKDKDFCIRCGACGKAINCVVRRGQKCPLCPAVREC